MLKTTTLTINGGRDDGKSFQITEMPLLKADRWAQRALFAIASSGSDADDLDVNGGMVEMTKFAFKSIGKIDPMVGAELLDELLECVQIIPSGGTPRDLEPATDIEDLKTLYQLRKEALMIHLDFLAQGNSPDLSN